MNKPLRLITFFLLLLPFIGLAQSVTFDFESNFTLSQATKSARQTVGAYTLLAQGQMYSLYDSKVYLGSAINGQHSLAPGYLYPHSPRESGVTFSVENVINFSLSSLKLDNITGANYSITLTSDKGSINFTIGNNPQTLLDIAAHANSSDFQNITSFSITSSDGAGLGGNIDDIVLNNIVDLPCTAPVITGNPPNRSICNGGNTTFTSSATGATAYQWQVNNGAGFTDISNGGVYSNATTNTLTITGATATMNGYQYRCRAMNGNSSCFSRSNPATLNISNITTSTAKNDVLCYGNATGSAAVSPTGGIGTYTYSWAPSGGTGSIATGLTAGTYTCTITDAISCQIQKSFTITQPASALNATITKTDVSCNGGSNGTATVVPTGGTSGYTYSWAPSGGTAATASGLAVGVYTCTITDANNCQITRSITITQPPALNTTAGTKTDVSCNGGSNGTATVSPTGGKPPYTYSWAPSGGTAATATGLAVGVYTVTVTDANACQGTKSFTITQPTVLDATISKTDVSCNGGSNGTATVVPTGGTSDYTYSWAPSGGTAATASGLAVGVYTCTITDANNCQITRSITITQPPVLNTTAGTKTDVSCNGGSNGTATVSPTGGKPPYTYSWAPSGGTAATATGLAVGIYTVTVTDANACQGTKSFTITQPTVLDATISKTDVSCNGGSNGTATVVPTGGTSDYTYSWAPSGGTAATASGLAVGVYTCTITDANNCQITRSITITQPTALTATTSSTDVSCNGASNGTATVNVSGGTPGYTYSWAPSGGTAATATGLAVGTYTCTITDENACTITRTFAITQPTALTATTSSTNVGCNGGTNGTATVNVSGGTPAYTYSWAPSGGTNATATGLAVGTYTCTITDANACTITRTFTITQPTALNTIAGSKTDVSCNGGSNGTATVSPTGGTPPYTYSWAPSGGTNATATGLAVGTYTVTVTDANNCQGTKTFTITQPTALTATTSSTNVSCNGGSNGTATVSPTGGTPAYTYSWAPSGGTAATATGLAAGTYTCTITDENACTITRTFTITQPTALGATISKTDVSNNGGSNGTATVTPSGGTGAFTYSWAPSGGTGATATGLSEGTYMVTITDQNSCSITRSIFVDAPPEAPGNLTVTAGNQQNELNWTVNGENDLAGYKVYGGTTSNTTVWLETVIPPLTNYTHSNLTNGTTYYYRITAVDQADNESTFSTEVTAIPKAPQTITFDALTAKTYGDADFDAGAATTSGLTISYSSDNSAVATIVAGKIHIVGAGTVNITASQTGNDYYKPAADEIQTLTVNKKVLTVTATATGKEYDGNTNAIVTLSDNRVNGDILTLANTTATFDSKNVGTNKVVNVTGISVSGTDATNYTYNNTASATADITTKALTVTAMATDKVYDGNANAIVTLSDNRVNGDILTLANTTATFDSKNVGTNKAVSVSGISITGADADNYTYNNMASATANITTKTLTVSATATDKVYDGNAEATVSLSDNRVTDDVLTLANTSATFNNKNVGTNKAVEVTGISISGTDANNYTFNNTASTTANITAKALTITATATDKVYDGNANAIVTLNDDRINGDVLTLANTTATFDNKNVGTNKPVEVTGISISGTDAINYTYNNTASAIADITTKALTVTAMATDKVYDGNTTAIVSLSDNRVSDDVLTLANTTATFDNKNAGTNKPIEVTGISIGGADADNYTFNTTASTTANITAKALTVTVTATDKVYDGNAEATVSLSDNRVTDDVLTLANTSATFNNKNVGPNKAVSVIGISIGGTDATNYTFNTTATATANITTKTLTVSATATDKVYDGNADATVSLSDNRIIGDILTLANTAATFDNKNAGTNKAVSVTGISIGGTDATNYTFNATASATANITAKALTVAATATDKVYDGNTNATVSLSDNRVNGDILTLANTAATFDNKNVGTNKSVSVSDISITGADAGNYTFNTTASATANITAKALTITATATDKVYDGNADATVSLGDNRITDDVLTLANTSATFDNKNVGTNKAVSVTGISIGGTDAANYTFNSTASATANITAKALTVTGTATDKEYDGNTNAIVTLSDDRVNGDVLSLANTSAAFDNKNVGTNKPVAITGISIGGADAINYTFNTTASATANITGKALTVAATATDKVYDGNTNATVSLGDNRVNGDILTLTYTTATFNNKNAGTNKPVSVSGISISGADAINYTFNTTASTTASITPKNLTVTATATDKVYDGNTNATVSLGDNRLTGDILALANTAATFDNKNVGTNKPVSVTGISISGTDAGNYTFNNTAATAASITPAKLSYVASPATKAYGDANPSLTGTVTGFVTGDNQANATSGTLSFSTPATNGSSIGSYAINGSGLTAANYTFGQAAGNAGALAVTARPITITADAKAKTYGDNDPALTYQITTGNLVNGDAFTGALVRDGGQDAGSYAIKQGTVLLSNNYNLSYEPADLTINKALLTVTANHSSRCYAAGNPVFSVSYSGFKYSDNENSLTTRPAVSTTANAGSAAGNYELVASGGGSVNYDFSYVKGTLTVNPLPVNTIASSEGTGISKGQTTVLTVNSDNGTSYSWSSASGIISGENSASLTVRPMETTTYTVTVRNANGCESISTITIEVTDDFMAVEAENFITPNGDGVNDNWVIKNIDAYPNHTLTIVDRSGKEIYSVRNYNNDWNGTLNGIPLSPGTYYYVIRFDENQPARKMTRGFITIVKSN